MPDLPMLAGSLGKWRYFLTGLPLAVLFGLVCRAFGLLARILGEMQVFRGTCEETAPGEPTRVLVCFQDSNRLSHKAALVTSSQHAARLEKGGSVQIAMRRTVFAAGSYPQTLAEAADNGDILLRAEYRRALRRRLTRTMLPQLLICGIALAVLLIAVRICFP